MKMKKKGQAKFALGAILLLSHMYTTQQNTIQGMQVYPLDYAFPNNSVTHGDSHCERYDRRLVPHIGINISEYFYCSHPGLLTDSNLGPEQLSQLDNDTEVYTWEPGVNRLLLTFAPPPKNITTIVLYYYRNNVDVGLPKARFCAVSEDFEIWNNTDSNHCQAQDEIRPGESSCDELACRENTSIAFNFYTEKLLMRIEDSKNYRFVLSEIEFYATEAVTTAAAETTTTTTTTESDEVDISGRNTGSTLVTVNTPERGTTEELDGAAVGSVHCDLQWQIEIIALVFTTSVASILVQF